MKTCLWIVALSAPAYTQHATGFEELPAGEFEELEHALGTWYADRGAAEIDLAHAKAGTRCLHLFGGEESVVELELFGGSRDVWELSFWAERWTSRAPFSFHVDARQGGRWRELYDGTDEVRVGRGFLSHVRIPIDGALDALRFRCSSPEGTGILIDELELHRPQPMRLASAAVAQPVLPVLIGNRLNPVARVDLSTTGNVEPLVLTELDITLEGTSSSSDIRLVEVYWGGDARTLDYRQPDEVFAQADRFGRSLRAGAEGLTFRGRRELPSGQSCLWISVQLDPGADIDGRIDAGCTRLELADGSELVPESAQPAGAQRMGVALRTAGEDGSAVYRIPGIVTTPSGALVAVYDARWNGWGDLPGHIDVAAQTSHDGGRSWSAMTIVMDMGDDPAWRGEGVGDPAVLVDPETGRVYVLAVWSHGNRGWSGSGPGLTPEETGQLMLAWSDDDGASWSALRNLTAEVKDPAWCFLLQGPGRGIAMHDGALVFPAQFQLPPEGGREPRSTVLVSRDHGESWTIGTAAKPNTTESTVVELEDGVLMLNMRDNRGGSRAVHVTRDLGASWEEHQTSRRALPEPVCNASLIHVGRELGLGADGRLVFINPNVAQAPRRSMSLKASDDYGASWPAERVLLLDEGSSAGYPCLTMIDAETIGVLYEGSRAHIVFQRVPLAELFPDER